MEPVILSGSRVILEPIDVERIELGDIVVVEPDGSGPTILRFVKEIDHVRQRVEISGTSGQVNRWTTFGRIDAICTRIGERCPKLWGVGCARLRVLRAY